MGQAAVVDLPDPLNPPPAAAAPESVATTDDLLAQMAGAEIDRLLAEQDGERPAAPAPSPTPAYPAQNASAAVPAPAKVKPDPMKSLLGALAEDPDPDPLADLLPAKPPAAQPVAAAAPAASTTTTSAKSAAELLDEELAADEARTALSARHAAADPDPDIEDHASAAVPAPLRALAWISSPLDSCPDHVREAIGKIAILTSVNALAVLIYVLFFRQHHG